MFKKNKFTIALVIVCLVLLVVTAYSSFTTPVDPSAKTVGTYQELDTNLHAPLEKKYFSSDKEYLTFLKSTEGTNYYGGGMMRNMAFSESMPMDDIMSTSLEKSAVDFSETNNQVQGVDEADLIKTDGEYIYSVSEGSLFIVHAFPGEDAEVVSTIESSGTFQNIFVNENKLVLFGYARDNDLFQKYGISSYSSMTFMNIYDISKKDEPLLLKNYTFEGSYFSARMIDDDVHLVLRNHPIYRDVFPTPLIIEGSMDSIRSVPVDRISYFPISYRNPELVVVHSFSLDDLGSLNSEAVTVDYANSIYMSNNNLYIVSDQYISEYELGQDVLKELAHPLLSRTELGLIGKIKQTDNDVLSQQEKESKIMGVYYAFLETLDYEAQEKFQDDIESETKKRVDAIDYFEYSVIHRLEIDGAKVSFKATGKVPGRIVNQFSLDEFDNNLRIATTISPRWSQFDDSRRTSTNSLWVLNNDLAVVGEMSDLAEDERIYSTRFVGDRLYMVTFRQVDPFFVIDLSNPQDPKVLGELKIPGFSKYLHPYDANHIIGIGQEATDTGRTTGLKISLFDVTDVSNPIEVAKYVTEERYVSSTALYEHKAFLFSKEKNLLVIPAFNHNYQENGEVYNGAFVFNISTEAIELRGLVDHSKGSAVSYGAKVQRSLYIDNLLYTLSPGLLRINALSDLHGVKDVDLEKTNSKIPVY